MPREIKPTTQNPKIPLIIDSALAIIREHGDQGLTMRKVAARAGMSLGNLQYYFKNKGELLEGMVDVYFARCAASFCAHEKEARAQGPRETVEALIAYGVESMGCEIGKVFRELWTIAARDEVIEAHLQAYYRAYAAQLEAHLTPMARDADAARRAVSLLLPFSEGYDVLAKSLPLGEAEIAALLTEMILSILGGAGASGEGG